MITARRHVRTAIQVILVLLGLFVTTVLEWNMIVPGVHGRNDFLSLYAGARLAGTPGLYDADAVYGVVRESADSAWIGGEHLNGWALSQRYTRMPWHALLLSPLGALPYGVANRVWLALSGLALAGFVLLWPAPWRIKVLVVCWFPPVFAAIFNGQDITFVLLFFALSLCLARHERPWAAGMVLALCGAKFHLLLFVPVVAVAQRRGRFLCGLIVGASGLLALSFASEGWDWPRRYLAVLTDTRLQNGLEHMPNLHALFSGLPMAAAVEIAAGVCLLAAVWAAATRSASFEAPAALALSAGVLTAFHSHSADCAMLLPAILLVWGQAEKPARIPAFLLATPIPWFFLMKERPLTDLTRLLVLVFVAGVTIVMTKRAARTHMAGVSRATGGRSRVDSPALSKISLPPA